MWAGLCRYLLRVTLVRGYANSIVKDYPFWVRNCEPAPEIVPNAPPIKVRTHLACTRQRCGMDLSVSKAACRRCLGPQLPGLCSDCLRRVEARLKHPAQMPGTTTLLQNCQAELACVGTCAARPISVWESSGCKAQSWVTSVGWQH